jgi:hypothetical protein
MARKKFYAGFYVIYVVDANKAYTGASMNIYRRFSEHKRDLKKNAHKNKTLQEAYNTAFAKKPSNVPFDAFFPLGVDFINKTNEAKFVFIPQVEFLLSENITPAEKKAMKTELEAYEQATSVSIEIHLPSINVWLTPGTEARASVPVCIDGVFYKNKTVAATQFKIFNNLGKPDKRAINHRLETKKWATWCIVDKEKLIKRVRVMNSKGQRLYYDTWQYGEVITLNNVQVAKYWESPIKLG